MGIGLSKTGHVTTGKGKRTAVPFRGQFPASTKTSEKSALRLASSCEAREEFETRNALQGVGGLVGDLPDVSGRSMGL